MFGPLSPPGELAAGVIETARLRLEPWADAHFEPFARLLRDPAAIRYIRAAPLPSAVARRQHQRSLDEWVANGFGKRAVIESATDEWIGFVELSRVGPGKGCRDEDVELGYFIAPARWKEGFATEAATASRDEAFGHELDELFGRCRVENLASALVLQKLGFAPIRHFRFPDGNLVEIHRLPHADWAGGKVRPATALHPDRESDYRQTG